MKTQIANFARRYFARGLRGTYFAISSSTEKAPAKAKALASAVVVLWLFVPAVYATDRAYSFGAVNYSNTDGLDSWSGNGSYEIGGNFRIAGGISLAETQGLTLRTFTLGAGYIARLSSSTDLIIDAGLLNAENQFLFVDAGDDEWGGYGGVKLRFAAGESVDIEPSLTYVKLFDVDFGDDDQFVYGVKARFWFASRFAVEVGVADSKDAPDPTVTIGMRFGRKDR